ncbi:MAG: immunity 53 family protein [Planctomycetes bacterium]|nr:immunity 53 family protein [Planctomycetota bacterium]
MNNIGRIQKWYASQGDGDWEHTYGVNVETLDNPGWSVDIELHHTKFAGVVFAPVEYGVGPDSHPSDPNWLVCKVVDRVFSGRGGPDKLDEIFGVFCNWAEKNS